MSENNHSEANPTYETPAMTGVDTMPGKTSVSPREWCYSGKAMRAQFALYLVISLALLGLASFLTFGGPLKDSYAVFWIGAAILLLLLWGQFFCTYFYRTWTIRYRLTEYQLDTIQGFFTKTVDTTELLNITDLRLVVTLWDRLFNGGVGKIIVFSSTDKTDPELPLIGIENPQEMFDVLNKARAEVRKRRGFITG